MRRRVKAAGVALPKGVHRVVARSREYYYFQPGRGTSLAGKRVRLPDDPHSPAFWAALQDLRGDAGEPFVETVGSTCDRYEASPQFRALARGSQTYYRVGLNRAREMWGGLPIAGLTPRAVQVAMDQMSETPGAANNFLGAMRALAAWALVRGYVTSSFTQSVRVYKSEGGHKPWTEEQIAAAHRHLTGMTRRGVMLMLYTGQRGSDVVRMGWSNVDDGGLELTQVKTGKSVWCPIVPELADEMSGWERTPGPFVTQPGGQRYSRQRFWLHFKQEIEGIRELDGVTLHGLRATAVIRLRRSGLATAQIQDIVGMSMGMIERYSRFADRKASGKAAVLKMEKRAEL